MVTYRLPWPPSVNHYYGHRGNGSRYIRERGALYRREVWALVCSSGPPPEYAGRLWVKIECFPPDKRHRDLDNILKALLDALELARVFVDDNQIDRLELTRHQPVARGSVVVTIGEIG